MGKAGERPGRLARRVRSGPRRATCAAYLADPSPTRTPCSDATTRLSTTCSLPAHPRRRRTAAVRGHARARDARRRPRRRPAAAGSSTAFSYSDGFGREIQRKVQAEPGPLDPGGPSVAARWVGSGWTIFNNKGKPVRQYEPFFSTDAPVRVRRTRRRQPGPVLRPGRAGGRDAAPGPHLGEGRLRPVARRQTWDVNDTVAASIDPRDGPRRRRLLPARLRRPASTCRPGTTQRSGGALGAARAGRRAAKTAAHADTPTAVAPRLARPPVPRPSRTTGLDAQRRTPRRAAARTRVELDIEGNAARGRRRARPASSMRYDYDMLGNRVHQAQHGGGRALDARRRRRQAGALVGQPRSRVPHRVRRAPRPRRHRAWLRSRAVRSGHARSGSRVRADRVRREPASDDARATCAAASFSQRRRRGRRDQRRVRLQGQPAAQPAGELASDYDQTAGLVRRRRQPTAAFDAAARRYDALNRPIERSRHPRRQRDRATAYNEASLLERVDGEPARRAAASAPVWTPFVQHVDYDAKGQRTLIEYGNGVRTAYQLRPAHVPPRAGRHDPQRSPFPDDCPARHRRVAGLPDPGPALHLRPGRQHHAHPATTRSRRSSSATSASSRARLHLRRALPADRGDRPRAPRPDRRRRRRRTRTTTQPRIGLLHPGDGNAMGRYIERYVYDAVGNIRADAAIAAPIRRTPAGRAPTSTTKPSLLEPGERSNRLTSTTQRRRRRTRRTERRRLRRARQHAAMPHLQERAAGTSSTSCA